MSLPARLIPALHHRDVGDEVARDFTTRLLELGIKAWVAYDHIGLAFLVSCDRHGLRRLDASKAGWPDGERPCSVDAWLEAIGGCYPNRWERLG